MADKKPKKKGWLASLPSKIKSRGKEQRAKIRDKKKSQTTAGMKSKNTRPKVQSVQVQGPKTEQRSTGKSKTTGPSAPKNVTQNRVKARTLSTVKAQGVKDTKASPEKKNLVANKESYRDQAKRAKQNKKLDKSKKIMGKADKAAKKGNIKKAARLEGKSERKAERAVGLRKSAVGTALSKAGRGVFGGLAALGGNSAALRKGGTKGSTFSRQAQYKKPNPAKLKPLSSKFRVVNKAADQDKNK